MNPFHLFSYGAHGLEKEKHSMSLTQRLLTALFSVWMTIYGKLTSLYANIQLRLWGAKIGKGFKVKGFLVLRPIGRIVIGNNVRINSGPLHVGGSDRRTAFRVGRCGTFTMKDGAGMSNSSINCFNEITICEGAMIGGGCELMDTDFHQIGTKDRSENKGMIPSAPIIIGKNAFVGGMSIIRRGVTVGEGSIIGMGSLVTKSVPPYEIWGGVPAKLLKKLPVPEGFGGEQHEVDR